MSYSVWNIGADYKIAIPSYFDLHPNVYFLENNSCYINVLLYLYNSHINESVLC